MTAGRVPSYLGSSGSVVSAVVAVTGYTSGDNKHIPVAQGGIFVLAIIYIFISILVILFGYEWVEFLMPPGKYLFLFLFDEFCIKGKALSLHGWYRGWHWSSFGPLCL